jgi:transcriptional regulator GlxA family with amidase domain
MATLAIAAAACSAPQTPATPERSPRLADPHASTIDALKPPKRARPVIAVIAHNDGTETTDFVVPYAVLAASRAADVFAVAPEDRAIKLTPALAISPQLTIDAFDARYPGGADYVIVPKIDKTADAAVVSWIQQQAAKGTLIVGICSGVKTVGAAGLLDDRAATGHWFDIEGLQKAHPTMRWVRDRRYVVDRGVMTTTGVSASMPASLALVEAFAGRERAAALATELGEDSWDERHDSDAFYLDTASKQVAERNRSAGVMDLYAVPVAQGVDDIAVAFTADAWSRSFRSKALAVASAPGPIATRHGLELLPDAVGTVPGATVLPAPATVKPGKALPTTLQAIEERYGTDTAAFIALQLEYAWRR